MDITGSSPVTRVMNMVFVGMSIILAGIFSFSYSDALFSENDWEFTYITIPSGILLGVFVFAAGAL